jgi:hypothetical protein
MLKTVVKDYMHFDRDGTLTDAKIHIWNLKSGKDGRKKWAEVGVGVHI